MKKLLGAVAALCLVSANLAACASPTDTSDDSTANLGTEPASSDSTAPDTREVCSGGRIKCLSRVVVDVTRSHASGPSGLGAKDLASAYALDTSIDPHATVAIIDAYGYAKAEADLKVYRSQYGLPACTIASGCLTVVNQDGNTTPLPANPPANDDWTMETALDLDMASAACPKCKILLVQATTDQDDGLFLAQATAARLGATVISNSWGFAERSTDPATGYEHYFSGLGNAGVFVAAGDSGYDNGGQGPDYPSTSAYVTAVGGTKLTKSSSSSRGWTEVAWSGSSWSGAGGSSCSLSIPKPSYQGSTACNFRAASDVAAVGDPASGPAIYNAGQWSQIGGTSAASPLVAGIYALTGHGTEAPSFAYANTSAYWDVTSGTNGTCGNVLCKAGAGWDGPTGVGTPNGKALAALQ